MSIIHLPFLLMHPLVAQQSVQISLALDNEYEISIIKEDEIVIAKKNSFRSIPHPLFPISPNSIGLLSMH